MEQEYSDRMLKVIKNYLKKNFFSFDLNLKTQWPSLQNILEFSLFYYGLSKIGKVNSIAKENRTNLLRKKLFIIPLLHNSHSKDELRQLSYKKRLELQIINIISHQLDTLALNRAIRFQTNL